MSQRHKIVLLTDCLAYLTGGAERQIFELSRGLDKKKYEVIIASLESEGAAPREVIESTGVRLELFPVKRVYGLSGIREGLRFIRFLRREKAEILMTFHFSSDLWGTLCGRLAGVGRVISNRRDMGFWRKFYHVWVYRLIDLLVDKVIVNACAIKNEFMRQEGLPDAKVEVIYNGIDLKFPSAPVPQRPRKSEAGAQGHTGTGAPIKEGDFKKLRKQIRTKLRIKQDDVVIMHVGCMTPVKDHATLIKAFGQVVKLSDEEMAGQLKLVLIGDGSLREDLQSLSASLGLWGTGELEHNNILFLGEREDARELIQAADVCVLNSESEGLSNAILEYMAAGKPVIATRVGGNPELIQDGVNGILIEKRDEPGLSAALSDLINDKDKRKRLGKESLRLVQDFGLPKMLQRYDVLFREFKGDSALFHNVKKGAVPFIPVPPRPGPSETGELGNRGTGGPLRILHLISSNGMFGAEQILLILCRELNKDGIESVAGVLHNQHNPHLEVAFKAKDEGIPYKIFDCIGRVDLKTVWRISQYIKDSKTDIIHTHNYKSNLIGLLAARLARIKIIATAHGFTDMNRKVSFYEMLDKFILRLFFNKVVCVSPSVLPKLPRHKKTVIPNGIDLNKFKPDDYLREAMRRQFPAADHEIVIGTVGRFSKEKNQLLLLKAVFPLMRAHKIKVVLVGDGDTLNTLTRYVSDRHLEDRVIFTGILQDPSRIYQGLDIFVLPSLTEGVPLTVLEAMASEVAVVATRVGGIPGIIRHAENGLLVNSQDRDALQSALDKLICDTDERRRLARAGREFVREHYAIDTMTRAYRATYHKS